MENMLVVRDYQKDRMDDDRWISNSWGIVDDVQVVLGVRWQNLIRSTGNQVQQEQSRILKALQGKIRQLMRLILIRKLCKTRIVKLPIGPVSVPIELMEIEVGIMLKYWNMDQSRKTDTDPDTKKERREETFNLMNLSKTFNFQLLTFRFL